MSSWCYRGLDCLNLSTHTNVTAPTRLFIVIVIQNSSWCIYIALPVDFFLAFQAESSYSRLILSSVLRTEYSLFHFFTLPALVHKRSTCSG